MAGEKFNPFLFDCSSAALLMAGALALPCASIGADRDDWRKVNGADLHRLFSEKEFGDGVHWAYRFKGNGTFTGTEMSKAVSGSWQVRGNEFCWKWLRPPGPEECYEVQQDGNAIRMLVNRSEAWYGTLAPLRRRRRRACALRSRNDLVTHPWSSK